VLHAKFGRSALNGLGINAGEPPKLGSIRTPLSWGGRVWLIPRYTLSPHDVKFGSSAIKGVRINRKEPPKLSSAGIPHLWAGGVADILKQVHSQYALTCQIR